MANEQSAEVEISENQGRFREFVIDPLKKKGMRKPRGFRVEEWDAELDEVGEDLGCRSDDELGQLRRRLMHEGVGVGRRTWPSVIAIRGFAHELFAQAEKKPGIAPSVERAIIDRIVSFVERHNAFPPPNINSLKDPGRVSALLALKHPGITLASMRKAGHTLPAGVDDQGVSA